MAVAAVAGVFAMHGLTHHGEQLAAGAATHADAHAMVSSVAVPALGAGDQASLGPVAREDPS